MANKFREKYHEAHQEVANKFGYNRFTCHPNENWNPTKISPADISSSSYQMFLAGAQAALDLQDTQGEEIKKELSNLLENFKKE